MAVAVFRNQWDGSNGVFGDVWQVEDQAPASAPENLTASPQSPSQIDVSWDAVSGATGYHLEIDGGSPIDVGTDLTYEDTGLSSEQGRDYRVRAYNDGGLGPWSSTVQAITPAQEDAPDDYPDVFTAFPETSSQIDVQWSSVDFAEGYELEIDGGTPIDVGDVLSHEDDGLSSEQTREYRVRAYNSEGAGPWSNLITATTFAESDPPDAAPSGLSVSTLSVEALSVSWDSVGSATGYQLEIDSSETDVGNVTQYMDAGLSPDQTRTYRVRAYNDGGYGPWSGSVNGTTAQAAPPEAGDPAERRTYLLEIEAHDGSGQVTLRVTDGEGYRSHANDNPSLAYYKPVVSQAGNYEVSAFQPGQTGGVAQIGAGEVVIKNTDGSLDAWLDYGFDGWALVVKRLDHERQALSQAVTVATMTMEQVEFDDRNIRFRIRDRLELLREDIQDNLYEGTTIDGSVGGAEGDESIADQVKPLIFGRVLNVRAITVDRFNLVFQVHDGALSEIDAVYDSGFPLQWDGTNYSSVSALTTATVPPGQYAKARSIGMIKLGTSPVGTITIDAAEGSSANRTTAQVVRRMITGYTELEDADLALSTFDGLDSQNSSEVGIFIDGRMTVIRAVEQVLESVGAFLVPDRFGRFRVHRFDLPSGSPLETFTEDDWLGSLERIPTGDEGRGVPSKKWTVHYRRNWTTQTEDQLVSGVLACIGRDRLEFLVKEWRDAVSEDSSVKEQHKLAPSMEAECLLLSRSDALSESARRQSIYGTRRDRYSFRVMAKRAEMVGMNDVVELRHPRFGLSDGKLFRVIGRTVDFERDTILLDVWGGV